MCVPQSQTYEETSLLGINQIPRFTETEKAAPPHKGAYCLSRYLRQHVGNKRYCLHVTLNPTHNQESSRINTRSLGIWSWLWTSGSNGQMGGAARLPSVPASAVGVPGSSSALTLKWANPSQIHGGVWPYKQCIVLGPTTNLMDQNL